MMDLTAFDAALKDLYVDQRVKQLVYENRPLVGILPKREDFYGRRAPLPLQYAHGQGLSGTFSDAQAVAALTESKLDDFMLTRVKQYNIVHIDNETMEASSSDVGAFMEARTSEINGAFEALANELAIDLYGAGDGVRGRIAVSGIAEAGGQTTITLSNADDIVRFEVGMYVVAAATRTGALLDSGASYPIVSIDRLNGTFVLTGLAQTTSSWDEVTGSYLFRRGDAPNGGALKKVVGLAGWISDAASPAALFGVTRTTDRTRLAGIYTDQSSKNIDEALIDGLALARREGAFGIKHVVMNTTRFADLTKRMENKGRIVQTPSSDGVFSYRGFEIPTPKGVVTVLEDMWCPPDTVYGIDPSTWRIWSLGAFPRFLGGDGLQMLRLSGSDGVEARLGGYLQVGCDAPGKNIRIKVATS